MESQFRKPLIIRATPDNSNEKSFSSPSWKLQIYLQIFELHDFQTIFLSLGGSKNEDFAIIMIYNCSNVENGYLSNHQNTNSGM